MASGAVGGSITSRAAVRGKGPPACGQPLAKLAVPSPWCQRGLGPPPSSVLLLLRLPADPLLPSTYLRGASSGTIRVLLSVLTYSLCDLIQCLGLKGHQYAKCSLPIFPAQTALLNSARRSNCLLPSPHACLVGVHTFSYPGSNWYSLKKNFNCNCGKIYIM